MAFRDPVPICTELMTPAGPLDNFLVTATGMPVLVECKLWRNPQARREVVGQVLDYAKELSRWSSADIEREARKRGVTSLIERVCADHPDVDEAIFHDSLTRNLARGRCLLLIVGDGIREGVEAIFEHLRDQSMLHFSLGMVELPVYTLPDGARLVAPRIVARTAVEIRRVVELPQGMILAEDGDSDDPEDPDVLNATSDRYQFWQSLVAALRLDDAEQPLPRPTRQGYCYLPMPVLGGTCWITIYREVAKGGVGLTLSYTGQSMGEQVVESLLAQWGDIAPQLGPVAGIITRRKGGRYVSEWKHFGDLTAPAPRAAAISWLAERANVWVNVFRPAIRSIAADVERLER